jgi:recombination protein RecR
MAVILSKAMTSGARGRAIFLSQRRILYLSKNGKYPPQITELVQRLSRLPGLGQKSATRLALFLMRHDEQEVRSLARAMVAVKEEIRTCSVCHNYTEEDPCRLCSDPERDQDSLCVVENPADLLVIESQGLFRGRYHILGGVINALAGIGPDELYIDHLLRRLRERKEGGRPFSEVILATGSSAEGETTCAYLHGLLGDMADSVTRLAIGMPLGLDLEYVDNESLKRALTFRRQVR